VFGVICVTTKLFDTLYYENHVLGRSTCVGVPKENEAVVQSLITVQSVTTSTDEQQAFKNDLQRVAARIATRLREAGYLCTVLESPSPSDPGLQPK